MKINEHQLKIPAWLNTIIDKAFSLTIMIPLLINGNTYVQHGRVIDDGLSIIIKRIDAFAESVTNGVKDNPGQAIQGASVKIKRSTQAGDLY